MEEVIGSAFERKLTGSISLKEVDKKSEKIEKKNC
jgi:hypothetical protein